MRRWIAGGTVAALLVAAGAILLADHAPGESKLREELWLLRQKLWVAERNGKKDGAAAVRALEALLAKARSENLPDVQATILDQLAIEYRALAEEYRLGKRYDDAVDAYKALLALPAHLHSDGQRQSYQNWIAELGCLGERREEGIAQYREMLAADASSGSLSLLGFATCLKAAGRIEESLDVLRKNVQRTYTAVKVRRDDIFRAHADLARALADAKRPDEARAAFLALLPIFSMRGSFNARDSHDIAEREREFMERNLIYLIDELGRKGVFAEGPPPN